MNDCLPRKFMDFRGSFFLRRYAANISFQFNKYFTSFLLPFCNQLYIMVDGKKKPKR